MDIQKVEWSFPASNGEGDIFTRGWLIKDPRALVQIAHGMSEHSARYEEYAALLCEWGFSVVANDHTGHGRSAQGHLGTFAQKPGGFDFVIEDLERCYEYAEEQIGKLPRVLLGHSMGSMLAALYADRHDDIIALIMTGSPAPIAFSGFAIWYAGRIIKRRGYLARSRFLDKMAGSSEGLADEAAERKKAWLTRDIEVVRAYIADPLCGFDFTASGLRDMLCGFREVASPDWGKRIPDIPVLIAAGANDSVGGNGKGPERYARQLQAAGHTDVTLKLFTGGYHEMHNEPDKDVFFEYLREWLDSRVDAL